MNGTAGLFLVVALALSALDWFAVVRRNKVLEYVCKPSAALAFLATTIALDPASDDARLWLGIALVFCVLGDVFLMLPRDAFVPGLASFAVAQVLLAVGFTFQDPTALRLVVALIIVVPAVVVLARRFIGALGRSGHRDLILPIVVYMVVISSMVTAAISGGTAIGIVGAVLFLISDSLIAEERFVASRRWQPLTIIITYHLALASLVVGLV